MKEIKSLELYKVLQKINQAEVQGYNLDVAHDIAKATHKFLEKESEKFQYFVPPEDIIKFLDAVANMKEFSEYSKFDLYVTAMYYFFNKANYTPVPLNKIINYDRTLQMGEKARNIPGGFDQEKRFDRISFFCILAISAYSSSQENHIKTNVYATTALTLHTKNELASPLKLDQLLILYSISCGSARAIKNYKMSVDYGSNYINALKNNSFKDNVELTTAIYMNVILSRLDLQEYRDAFFDSQELLKITSLDVLPLQHQYDISYVALKAKKYQVCLDNAEKIIISSSTNEDKNIKKQLYAIIVAASLQLENYEKTLQYAPVFLETSQDKKGIFLAFSAWIKAADSTKNVAALKQIAEKSADYFNKFGYEFVSKVLAKINEVEEEKEQALAQQKNEEKKIKKKAKKENKKKQEKIELEIKKSEFKKTREEIGAEEKIVEFEKKVEEKNSEQKIENKEAIKEVKLEKKLLTQPVEDKKNNKKNITVIQTDKLTKTMPFFAKTQPIFGKVGDRSSLMQLKADFLPKNNGIFCCLEFTKDIEAFQKSQPGAFLKLYSQIEESTVCLARNDQGLKYVSVDINGTQYDWEVKIKSKNGEGDWRILGRTEQEKSKEGKIITKIVFDLSIDHKTFHNQIKKGSAPLQLQAKETQHNEQVTKLFKK